MNADDLINYGKKLYLEGNLEAAKSCFLQIIDQDSAHLEALNNLAVILFYEGQYELAHDTLKRVLSIDPAHRDGLMNLYDLLKSSDNEAHFIPYMETAIAVAPQDQELEILYKTVKKQNSLKVHLHIQPDVIDGEAFFILSPGRCGISTVNEVINTATNVKTLTNLQADLIPEISDAFWDRRDKCEFLLKHRRHVIEEALKERSIYGETSPAMIIFADVLKDIIPKAKFVIIARDPLTYTRSALFQNFYHGHPEDGFRLTPQQGSEAFRQWKKKNQAEKIYWLWNEFYSIIERVTSGLDQDSFMICRFEELFSNIHVFRKLFDFLNLKGFSSSHISSLLEIKRNASDYGRFPSVKDWSFDFMQGIEQATSKLGVEYGYFNGDKDKNCSVSQRPVVQLDKIPEVSIGLPLYSGGKMLTNSVESILGQDFENFELIISDHGNDPFVREIGAYYEKLDKRVKFIHTGDNINYIGIHNFARMFELSTAPYFMWGSYDDCLEKTFISSCLKAIRNDPSIALVYPKSKVYNRKGEYLGLGEDAVKADADDPFDRFLHVIWELRMCHAFHGVFRRSLMRKTHSLRKNCYAHDNLFLAEIALLGKIVQIDDVLFIRHLTRDYQPTLAEHYTDVIRSLDPLYLEEGLTMPFCRFTYSHCELVNHSPLPPDRKEYLTREILRCFRQRWSSNMKFEIEYLIKVLKHGIFYRTWDGRVYKNDIMRKLPNLHYFLFTDVLKSIREALFIFPEHEELKNIFALCLDKYDFSYTMNKPSNLSSGEVD